MKDEPSLLQRASGPAIVAVVGVAAVAWGWGRRPDVLVDFGRELYVPWRLAAGEVLYSDIAYFNGPLSPYWNAIWFRAFGASLQTLSVVNAVLLALLVALLYRLLRCVASRLAATVACLLMITTFATSQLDTLANYNFLTPYSHEATHGLLLALLGFAFLFVVRGRTLSAAGSGFCFGLVFLTKPEIFVAALGLPLALLATSLADREPTSAPRRELGGFALAALIPPAVAFALLWSSMPAEAALGGVLGAWRWVFRSELISLPLYRWSMGTLDPGVSLALMGKALAQYALLFLPAAAVAWAVRGPARLALAIAIAVFVLYSVYLRGYAPNVFPDAIRPLPVFLAVMAGIAANRLRIDWRRGEDPRPGIMRLSLLVFAFLLLGKVLLKVTFRHYNFALAMPGTMALVVLLVDTLPRQLSRVGGSGVVFRGAALAGLLACAIGLGRVTATLQAQHTVRIGEAGDSFLADGAAAPVIETLLADLAERLGPGDTLAVLPEGVMLNYLLRRTSSTPYINFMPPEIIMFDEEKILESFRRQPPDFIVFVHKETTEYGLPFFGRDYGRDLYAWVWDHYQPVRLIGDRPLQPGSKFGVQVMELTSRGTDFARAAASRRSGTRRSPPEP